MRPESKQCVNTRRRNLIREWQAVALMVEQLIVHFVLYPSAGFGRGGVVDKWQKACLVL